MQFTINRTYRNNLEPWLVGVYGMETQSGCCAPGGGQGESISGLPCKGGDDKPGNHADTCKREEWQAAMST
jgi:hypothetical protein